MVRAAVERWSRTTKITFGSIAIVVLLYAVFSFQRRWMADDGLIAVNQREILLLQPERLAAMAAAGTHEGTDG